jgi:hypothetical protein
MHVPVDKDLPLHGLPANVVLGVGNTAEAWAKPDSAIEIHMLVLLLLRTATRINQRHNMAHCTGE